MTNIELIQKIKAEIERRLKECKWQDGRIKPPRTRNAICYDELSELLSFLSTLESENEQPICEEQEEAAKQFVGYDMDTDNLRDYEVGIQSFIAGAKWQKEQMMKEAVETYYGYVNGITKVFLPEETLKGVKEGYNRIIILKDDGETK